jgi:hypothetical protein
MLATFVIWLLMLLPAGQQQLKAAPKNDTANQQAGKASSSVVPVTDNAPSHGHTDEAAQHQHANGKKPQPALLPPTRTERLCLWLDSLNTADWTLLVTAAYLIATVLIWRAMLASNKHAEKTYKESKDAAEEDRKLLRMQLEAYDRPWITGSIVFKEPITFEPGGTVEMWVYPVIKNVGKSVAIDISPTCKLIAIPRGHPDFLSFVTEQMQAVPRDPAQRNVGALFPGDTNDRTMNRVRVSSEEIATGSFTHGGATRLSLVCICAIFYRFANSTTDHVTRFAYHIGQSNPMRTGGDMNIRVGTRIQSSEIITLTHPFSYAD